MTTPSLSTKQKQLIDELVDHYLKNLWLYRRFLNALHSQVSDAIDPEKGDPLARLVHSVKFRLKNPGHLRDKLVRKMLRSIGDGTDFPYNCENLFVEIGDLAGYRIMHLHTRQFEALNQNLIKLLEESHRIVEGPRAKTWDEETKSYYESIGIAAEHNERLYSSVHYLVQPSIKTTITIEIQVRTLADEIWGEIDHKINYPYPHPALACREQIKALARVTSSCSRLVDSIMSTHHDWEDSQAKQQNHEPDARLVSGDGSPANSIISE